MIFDNFKFLNCCTKILFLGKLITFFYWKNNYFIVFTTCKYLIDLQQNVMLI